MKRIVRLSVSILVLLFVFVIAYSTVHAFPIGKKSKPSSIKNQTSDDSGQKTTPSEVFKGERPVGFRFEASKVKGITIYSCGYRYNFTAYEQCQGEILIPLSDQSTDLIFDRMGASVRYDKDNKEIELTRGDKKMRMKIDYGVADFCGEKRDIPVPPRIINGMVHISPNSFAKFLWACLLYDDKRNFYYLDPFLIDVSLETKRGLTKVVARGTGPFKNRILKLRQPNRFVIDVMNCVLDGKARSIDHPQLGPIRFSQHMLKGEEGNIVRIVIPETESFEVALAQPRALNYVEAELRGRQQSVAPVQDLSVQKIQNLQVIENPDKVIIIMDTTGPVQIGGSRLLPPDDRIFIDIPKVLFPDKKKEFNLKSDFLPTIRVAQFSPLPDPKVRVVLPLEGPRKVTLESDDKNPNRVRIIVSKTMVNPKEDRTLFLVTCYPAKGLVICIDPGHGGSDSGAYNKQLRLAEKDITLDISRRLTAILKSEGWNVAVTRSSDRDVTYAGSPDSEELAARTSVANGIKAHLFVSIHINASVNSGSCGFGTYWYKDKDLTLANAVQSSMVSELGCKSIGVRRERFYVTARTNMPAILVEAGFISHDGEAKLLSDPQFRQRVAQAIARGLKNYAGSQKFSGKLNSKSESKINRK
jgi:N-acetylmuramoyl-L-alanine amidase